MSDAALFLRKRKDKVKRARVPSRAPGGEASISTSNPSSSSSAPSSSRPNGIASSSTSNNKVKTEPSSNNGGNSNITEIKIFSSGSENGMRFNFMRLNYDKDIDPIQIGGGSLSGSNGGGLLLNRKKPGPKQPPLYAMNEQGKIIGKYVYDSTGKPVLDAEGRPTIEKRQESDPIDMSLVGTAPPGAGGEDDKIGRAPGKRKMKKGTKEVFHQDIEIMRLRREENTSWLLEPSKPKDKSQSQSQSKNDKIPEQWIGTYQEPSALPTVLLVNDGTGEGFEMVPLGRTYRFDPARPFRTLDSDDAIKMFELQAKHRMHDRWALRPDGENNVVTPENIVASVNVERNMEQRALKMEERIKFNRGISEDKKPKVEKFEDDYVREGRRAERGLEGGLDEELDFDETEHFQDDDDVNTFYRNAEEEDEAKENEEIQKKEYRLANANVGDKPQIAEDDDEDDLLFGEKKKLDDEGKKLKKIMRKRKEDGDEDDDMSSDESDESDTESINSKTSQNKDKKKEEDKDSKASDNNDANRPSGIQARGPGSRGTSSPTGKRTNGPMPGKASTAPPGSGSALLAQRAASRGVSPRPLSSARAGSPLSGRAASPESRATSPVMRGNSPVPGRGQSPGPARGSSPVSGPPTRDASPAPGSSSGQSKSSGPAKRKTTSESPGPGSGTNTTASPSSSAKRKNSPSGSADPNAISKDRERPGKKSKKSGSLTPQPSSSRSSGTPAPEEMEHFPGMITKQDVLNWFKSLNKDTVPMSEAIAAFRNRIMQAGKNRESNQKLFLGWMKMLADQEEKMLRLKEEYR